jgi:hypothetical protein
VAADRFEVEGTLPAQAAAAVVRQITWAQDDEVQSVCRDQLIASAVVERTLRGARLGGDDPLG